MRKFLYRDISWLQFNFRVLLEAQNKHVPVFERLRFLAIFSSNLDEFFRVRVGSLRNLTQIDKPKINRSLETAPADLVKLIQIEVNKQLVSYGKCWRQVMKELRKQGIEVYQGGTLTPRQRREVHDFFATRVAAFLKPHMSPKQNGLPFLDNRALYFGIKLLDKSDQSVRYSYVNIPSEQLGRFHRLPPDGRGRHCFVLVDDVVKLHLDKIYPGYEVLECKEVKVSRNADLAIEDEFTGDLVKKIRKQLKRRNLGSPTRFLFDRTMSEGMLAWFTELLGLHDEDLYAGGPIHNLNDYLTLPNPVGPKIEYPPQEPLPHPDINSTSSVLEHVARRDTLLHFPYQRYDYVLRFFNEAAVHPDVRDIRVVFYRMAKDSLIGEALISAARNGKKVMVFMEIKARFDEENNLGWAQRFKKAGVKVNYSLPGLKVHAKVALVRMVKKNAVLQDCAFFGTGNLNEKTARLYTDYALFTCDREMTKELGTLFDYLAGKKIIGRFERLLVSGFDLMPSFVNLVDRTIAEAKKGKKARIVIKLNNLEEKTMITKLYDASRAGVEVQLLVRGVCCIRPQMKNLSQNIRIKRLVDRYLEHSRVFIFDFGKEPLVYLGSADWMNRNLYHRIEVVFPVLEKRLQSQILKEMEWLWRDNCKAFELSQTGTNKQPSDAGQLQVRAQVEIYKSLEGRLKKAPKLKPTAGSPVHPPAARS